MTRDELQGLLDEWQRTLRLRDWDVEAHVCRVFEMSEATCLGECSWAIRTKKAYVRILDPDDYDPSMIGQYDPEQTLVHELLHLHFAPFCPLGEETDLHEQAVDAIACALVAAKRMQAS